MYIGSRRPNNIVLTQVNTLPTFGIACAAAIDGQSSDTNEGSAVGIPGSWSCAASVALRLLAEKGGLVTARSAAAIVYVSQGCLEQTESKGFTDLNAATA
ncbi:uncharacterized protein AtWU_03567 [Aspergillus tubingensis]|uniref:uncharacterized protein n=1 Tax=Aspergillus tubingensis TaxID=5068 RepID=UPI001578E23F|nr:uncharacterized protein AtWU_03567 [Aspergillus tubingensis]GFN13768.1 hypothetical protein AtWU_03567 [Aspergillus tubingensis]